MYIYKTLPQKKIDSVTTRLATVIVSKTGKIDKEIGQWSFSKNPTDAEILEAVNMIVKEYEVKRAWSGIND